MSTVHFMNVAPGDCTLIQHNSGRVSMVDICDGDLEVSALDKLKTLETSGQVSGNFGMCGRNTNPIEYAQGLGISNIWRFVLTHPDMDHMDGFSALMDRIGVANFWDSGARKSKKPEFGAGCPYREEDWDRYARVRNEVEPGVRTLLKREAEYFSFANRDENGNPGGDGLYILAPSDALIDDPNEEDDLNDASYVLLYRSSGGRIILPGDAHDASWEHVLRASGDDVRNASVLLAPHHGRDSDRSYEFLDVIQPKLTWIGCCPSEYIDYSQWRRRGLAYITSNQSGNLVLECDEGVIDVYVENAAYAKARGADLSIRNGQGYTFVQRIVQTPERQARTGVAA